MYLKNTDERGVITITLNRPKLHNAFNDEMIEKLTEEFKSIEGRLVVLKGEGKSFCAGADLNWMKSMVDYSKEENIEDAKKLAGLFQAVNDCPMPVMAIVHGAVLGGGCGLISACDFVLADEMTQFGFTEVRLGLVPAVISPFVMRKIGESFARAYFTSGLRFSSDMAMVMGLVHSISEDLESDAPKFINEFLKSGPIAACKAKELALHVAQNREARDYTCELIAELRASEEGQAGMQALLKKEKAPWLKK